MELYYVTIRQQVADDSLQNHHLLKIDLLFWFASRV
jgi:hypothetical protein